MALMNEKVTEVLSACSEPCLYYNNRKRGNNYERIISITNRK